MGEAQKSAVSNLRDNFVEQRLGRLRTGNKAPLISEVHAGLSEKRIPSPGMLREYLLALNEIFINEVAGFEAKFGHLQNPQEEEYIIGVKECIDARHAIFTYLEFLLYAAIHERTAAAGVRNGKVFRVLDDMAGKGFVITHEFCGGEDIAHKFHTGQLNPDEIDDQTRVIVESLTKPVACVKDPVKRSKNNAKIQITNAAAILEDKGIPNPVYPLMARLSNGNIGIDWLSQTNAREVPPVANFRSNLQMLWDLAKAIFKTSPEKQFAHTIAYYDPYRLGRFNDPRVIFAMLPNEMLCVTENFKGVQHGKPLSPSAVASFRYGGFLNGGHVEGVKSSGHGIIIDPDPAIIAMVKKALLAAHPEIQEQTRGGETIESVRYDLDTRKIEFIK